MTLWQIIGSKTVSPQTVVFIGQGKYSKDPEDLIMELYASPKETLKKWKAKHRTNLATHLVKSDIGEARASIDFPDYGEIRIRAENPIGRQESEYVFTCHGLSETPQKIPFMTPGLSEDCKIVVEYRAYQEDTKIGGTIYLPFTVCKGGVKGDIINRTWAFGPEVKHT